jgi:hypothetical protein
MNENGNAMNLYILNDVLGDYTGYGMAVIAAESMEQCRELFIEEFCTSDLFIAEYERNFNYAEVTVIEGVNHVAGVVSYVHGGS